MAAALAGCGDGLGRAPFDRERWLHADDLTPVRTEMVRSLLDDHPLKNMDRASVIELLGPPTETDKWPEIDLVYILGPHGIDWYWLLIKLDDQDRVSSARVRPD